MGIIYTSITVSNPRKPDLKPIDIEVLADTGALHLCIPEHVALQLQLEAIEKREVTTADGKKHACDYVGPVQITFENRNCFTGALVLGDQPLLGAVPMEDLDVVISPASQSIVVNPKSPNIPMSIAMKTA